MSKHAIRNLMLAAALLLWSWWAPAQEATAAPAEAKQAATEPAAEPASETPVEAAAATPAPAAVVEPAAAAAAPQAEPAAAVVAPETVAPDAAAAPQAVPSTPAAEAQAGLVNPTAAVATDDAASPDPRRAIQRGTGVFLNEAAAARRSEDPAAAGDVVFNFEGESLQAVIKAILGDLLGQNYVVAPGVQGQVTFATAKPISMDQAMGVLEMLLAWNSATLVYKDGRYTVLPVAQAIPGNLIPRMGPAAEARGYEIRVVPLKYISATAMQETLQPYARQGSIIKADNTRSMILIAGIRSDLEAYLQTIEIFDVDWLAGMSVGVFPLERVEASTVVPEMEKIFGEGGPTPLAGLFRFLPIERINAVLVITPQPDYLDDAEAWLRKLDRGGSESGSQLYVYYVKNVKAVDLADKLTEIFTGQARASSASNQPRGVGGVVPGIESVEIRSADKKQEAPRAPVPARAGSADGIAIVQSDEIRITSIEESNALMIRATAGEYDAILGAIKRLDIVPLQVHIEAKILQVDLSNGLSMGVEWFFENALNNRANAAYHAARRTRPDRDSWNSRSGTAGSAGLAWTFLNVEAEALITALQNESSVQVLSAPSLVVLNNKDASINVGKQIPVVSAVLNSPYGSAVGGGTDGTGTGTGTGIGGYNPSSYVQFRDTGIKLNVTPRVNPGGLVYMEISQEESTPGETQDATGNVPVDRRSIETEIAVQSGETVLLGGLIKETRLDSQKGVPGLSKIPLIGRFFGSTETGTARQELLVLITPTVIDSAESAAQLTEDYRERFKGLKPLLKRQAEETKHKE
ncbi:MAG: type II secretion system secretin GspD [Xanthomonadales bacterium]|nr:type II secretion system secretin GspD [Xanthomonadales bacterium]